MSQVERSRSDLERRPVAGRRVRHDVRDGLTAAALSLGASVAVLGLVRLAAWWLG